MSPRQLRNKLFHFFCVLAGLGKASHQEQIGRREPLHVGEGSALPRFNPEESPRIRIEHRRHFLARLLPQIRKRVSNVNHESRLIWASRAMRLWCQEWRIRFHHHSVDRREARRFSRLLRVCESDDACKGQACTEVKHHARFSWSCGEAVEDEAMCGKA